MQTATSNSLLIIGFSSSVGSVENPKRIDRLEFYQQIATGLMAMTCTGASPDDLGERLVTLAEQAYAWRQMGVLEWLTQAMMELPLPAQLEGVGRYYEAVCIQRHGLGNLNESARILEQVAVEAPLKYRSRALLSLGANVGYRGDYTSALCLYREASRMCALDGLLDPHVLIGAPRTVAVFNSVEGNHRGALAMLEGLFPLAHSMRHWHPHLYYDYMNSLAVELMEAGRLEEARNAARIALESPFAHAYPEWRETGEEITRRGWRPARSFSGIISFRIPKPNNVVSLAERRCSATLVPEKTEQPARIIDYLEWKKKMVKEPNDAPEKAVTYPRLSDREMLLKIIELISAKDLTENQLERILRAVEEIASEKREQGKK